MRTERRCFSILEYQLILRTTQIWVQHCSHSLKTTIDLWVTEANKYEHLADTTAAYNLQSSAILVRTSFGLKLDMILSVAIPNPARKCPKALTNTLLVAVVSAYKLDSYLATVPLWIPLWSQECCLQDWETNTKVASVVCVHISLQPIDSCHLAGWLQWQINLSLVCFATQ